MRAKRTICPSCKVSPKWKTYSYCRICMKEKASKRYEENRVADVIPIEDKGQAEVDKLWFRANAAAFWSGLPEGITKEKYLAKLSGEFIKEHGDYYINGRGVSRETYKKEDLKEKIKDQEDFEEHMGRHIIASSDIRFRSVEAPTKVCYTCKEEKPRVDFHKGPSSRDNLSSYCKPCASKKANGK